MKKYKKLALLLILCSVVSMFTGCDVDFKISINKLSTYVTTQPEGGTNDTIQAAFSDGRNTITTSLSNISTIFRDVSVNDGTAKTTVSAVTNAMNSNVNNVFESKLSDGKNLTKLGKDISSAFYIDSNAIKGTYANNYNDGLFAHVLHGITANVTNALKNNTGDTIKITNLNFDGSKASSRAKSEVNRALTITGYSIKSVNVGILMADEPSDVTTMNAGCSTIDEVAAKFIEDNPCMTANSTSCTCGKNCFGGIVTGGWSLNASTNADTNILMYYLDSNTSALIGYLNDKDVTENKQFPVIAGQEQIYIYPLLVKNSDDYGFSTTFKGKKSDEYNTGTFQQYLNKLGTGGWDGYGTGNTWRYTRGYAIMQFRELWQFCGISEDGTQDVMKNAICWEPIVKNGKITKFAGIIGGIKQVSGNGAGSNYWALLRIVIDVEHLSNTDKPYFDITQDLAGASSHSSAKANSYSLYPNGVSSANSIEEFVDLLDKTAAEATLVAVKEDFKDLSLYDTAEKVSDTVNEWGSTIQLGTNSPVEIVKKDGKDFKVGILDTLTNSDFDPYKDGAKQIKTDLYIGSFKLGSLYLETLNPDIAGASDVVAELSQQGLTATGRTMQKFKMFTKANDGSEKEGLYLLFGLSDIIRINEFEASKADTDTEYTYTPIFKRSGMIYNIFDKGIYMKSGNNKVVSFSTADSAVKLYNTEDIMINKRTWKNYSQSDASLFITKTDALKPLRSALYYRQSPFALNTYLEGLFCPNWVEGEPFVCLGRKVIFAADKVFTDTVIGEETELFNIVSPDMDAVQVSDTQTHFINELLSSTIQRQTRFTGYDAFGNPTTDTTMSVDAIIKPKYSREAEKIRSYSSYDSLDTISTLQDTKIYCGEFKTAASDAWYLSHAKHGKFANAEKGTEFALGMATPRLYVWCTATSVNESLPTYLNSPQFEMWRTWLNNNGYPTYLGKDGMTTEELTTDLVHRIESVYDLKFNSDTAGKDIIIDTSGLDQLDDWLDRKTEEKKNAIIDVILRIIAIILLIYGVAILVCYIIDVAVAGEGTGILKKVTFNRMMTVTGLTKEERKAMSERNEKGTYTTRAVAITDLIPIILIMWGIATILIIGSAYNIVDTLISIGEKITQIIRQAISKE